MYKQIIEICKQAINKDITKIYKGITSYKQAIHDL